MFLPNTDSFLLIRRPIGKPIFPVFSPNTDSFVLIRKPIAVADISQSTDSINSPQADEEQTKVNDQGKRNFLKFAGIAGAGIAAATLLPNKAHALIMGSSPTTGVVGVKNAANTRINPATEETVSSLSSFSDSANVAKKGLVHATTRNVQVDVLSSVLPTTASTETTLTTINYGGKKFTLRLATDSINSAIDYVGEANVGTLTSATGWRIKRIHNNYDGNSNISITWADGSEELNKTFDLRQTEYTYS